MRVISPDAMLQNWQFFQHPLTGVIQYSGYLYFDKKGRFRDGTFVTTSKILTPPDKNNVIKTKNSIYILGAPQS